MSYLQARNEYILSVNKPELKNMPEYFTPDDIAKLVGLAVKEYLGEDKVSLLDPMGGSGNLFFNVIKTAGKNNFSELNINRFKQKGDDKDLYNTISEEIGKLKGSDEISIGRSSHTIVKSKDTADFVIANLDGKFLGKHKVINDITNKYCFILDTNSPKNNINWDEKNFSIEKVVFLGDKIGVEGKKYYLYIYKKEKSGNKDFEKVFYNFNGGTKGYNGEDNIFIGKRDELILGKKNFDDLIKKGTLENTPEELVPINDVLNKINKSNRIINNNFSKLLSGIDINWTPETDMGVIEIIQNIQENQKIKSEKLYEILISLSVSNFLIFSGPSGVGKTSLVGKISDQIGGKYLKFPVKSNFSDETGLLGYWNPLLSKYEGTEVLEFLFESSLGGNRNRPFFLLLDEMNLSRIENYFSEFLIKIDDLKNGSIEIKLFETLIDNEAKFSNIKYFIETYTLSDDELEITGCTHDDILHKDFNQIGNFSIAVKINIYSNLHIIGTINEDDTTFSLSNKVLDRAFYIELSVEDLFENTDDGFIEYINTDKKYSNITVKKKGNPNVLDSEKEFFNQLNKLIQIINPMDAIGYRSIEEIANFFEIFVSYSKYQKGKHNFSDHKEYDLTGLDFVLCQKVWPKMNNYFLLGDVEEKFSNLLELIGNKLEKESRSYKKIENIQNNLINN